MAIYFQKAKLNINSSDFQSPKFENNFLKTTKFLYMVQVGSEKYRRMFILFFLSYLACQNLAKSSYG
jgi:hypothetical protein